MALKEVYTQKYTKFYWLRFGAEAHIQNCENSKNLVIPILTSLPAPFYVYMEQYCNLR
jgi:hypothetical protein